jgi:hypothetical protein
VEGPSALALICLAHHAPLVPQYVGVTTQFKIIAISAWFVSNTNRRHYHQQSTIDNRPFQCRGYLLYHPDCLLGRTIHVPPPVKESRIVPAMITIVKMRVAHRMLLDHHHNNISFVAATVMIRDLIMAGVLHLAEDLLKVVDHLQGITILLATHIVLAMTASLSGMMRLPALILVGEMHIDRALHHQTPFALARTKRIQVV